MVTTATEKEIIEPILYAPLVRSAATKENDLENTAA